VHDPARLEDGLGERPHGRSVDFEPLGVGVVGTAGNAGQLLHAALVRVVVEGREARERRHRDEEVSLVIAHVVLDVALLVAAGNPTEPVGEQVVTLQAQECVRELAVRPEHHLVHRDRGVVVGDLGGDAAEELEGGHVGLLERFSAL
jgi:hypothetical protein